MNPTDESKSLYRRYELLNPQYLDVDQKEASLYMIGNELADMTGEVHEMRLQGRKERCEAQKQTMEWSYELTDPSIAIRESKARETQWRQVTENKETCQQRNSNESAAIAALLMLPESDQSDAISALLSLPNSNK